MRTFVVGSKVRCEMTTGLEQVLKLQKEYIVTKVGVSTIDILLEDGIECHDLSSYRFIPVKE